MARLTIGEVKKDRMTAMTTDERAVLDETSGATRLGDADRVGAIWAHRHHRGRSAPSMLGTLDVACASGRFAT